MVRYLTPQLKRTYDRVVRSLMPWRMIDALENLEDSDRRSAERAPRPRDRERRSEEGRSDDDQGTSSTSS